MIAPSLHLAYENKFKSYVHADRKLSRLKARYRRLVKSLDYRVHLWETVAMQRPEAVTPELREQFRLGLEAEQARLEELRLEIRAVAESK